MDGDLMRKRCEWLTDDEIYRDYHDYEWGVPVLDDQPLFEMLILEGAQAGLSWITVLKRRSAYRKAYDDFDPEKMACWTDEKIQGLLKDSGIIRNKLKIMSAQKNAQAYLRLVKEYGSFKDFLYSFVGGRPQNNRWETLSEIPAATKESQALSKGLKKKGFNFVGPTICYAFMQATGMVNDHITSCYRYKEIEKLQLEVIQENGVFSGKSESDAAP